MLSVPLEKGSSTSSSSSIVKTHHWGGRNFAQTLPNSVRMSCSCKQLVTWSPNWILGLNIWGDFWMKLESHRTSGYCGTQQMPLLTLWAESSPPFRSCSTGQWFSNFLLRQNHMECFLNTYMAGPYPNSFWFRSSRLGASKNLIFNKFTANANDAGSESHIEKHCFRRAPFRKQMITREWLRKHPGVLLRIIEIF